MYSATIDLIVSLHCVSLCAHASCNNSTLVFMQYAIFNSNV